MGRKLEEEFPSIVWSPCASHCLDLLMEDIGKLEWIKSIISEATSIVDFINSKVRVLAIFRSYSDKELRKPSKTRFAAMWILLDRLYEVQNKLQKTVVSEEFKEWMDREPIAQQQEAKSIQRLCLRESFWKNVYGIIAAILPLYKVLRMTDMEGATIGVLYHFMKEAIEEIKKCTTLDEPCDLSCDILDSTPKRDDILYLVEKRWKWMKRPIHGIAALLHPAFKEASLFMDTTLLEDRDTYLPKILSCEKHATFLQEFINYNDQRGIALASPIVWKRDSLVKPLFWWESFGYQMPLLQRIAMRVLAQDCSSGACERNWSAYSLIHTKIRNKLSTKQLERLIYCRSNLRMLRTMHQMPMARQVNVDSLKLSLETLKSVQKERDIEEEQIFRDLYLELEEIDRRVNRTRSHSKVTIRASRH
ncbi:hypothetical protein KP509_12G081500 [Ceratopteris richardii]|uniref:HAT C-terminal dimerisation domain-containing protein n=1 Tax=Ceratopteris richardii TaxID=49495 RepID=A0A8T2TNH6_CERRI|nr:hypothetical protein KP509_12G081500 [Ceratopteris richardii]KAH7423930.1 hypothetical protein KP509_12G081500 [Ceratopteris richardii]